MITNNLFATPATRHFGHQAEADLSRELTKLERATSVRHVGSVRELCLDGDGSLPGGYRYTEPAFRQVCALACKGLYSMVLDLSGVYRSGESLREDYSFSGAIDLFNAVVRRRFNGRFSGKVRIVKDSGGKLVDGVLGPKYNYLENRAVYDMSKEAVASSQAKVRFHEAAISGRRLLIRYAHKKPLFELATIGHGVESFHGGYHFSNSEIAGEASVRAAVILLRRPDGTVSLGRFGTGRLAHTGKDFAKKLSKMFQSVLSAPQDATTLRKQVDLIRASPLNLGGTDQERDAQLEYLATTLHRQGVAKNVAGRIAVSAMQYGSYDKVGTPKMLTREALEKRTVYDFYSALTREARELPLAAREAVEQAAYGLLNGKIKLR